MSKDCAGCAANRVRGSPKPSIALNAVVKKLSCRIVAAVFRACKSHRVAICRHERKRPSKSTLLEKFAVLLCCFDIAPCPAGDVILLIQRQLPANFCGGPKHQ